MPPRQSRPLLHYVIPLGILHQLSACGGPRLAVLRVTGGPDAHLVPSQLDCNPSPSPLIARGRPGRRRRSVRARPTRQDGDWRPSTMHSLWAPRSPEAGGAAPSHLPGFGCGWSRPAGPSQAGEVTDRQRDSWAYPSAITAIAIRKRSVGGIHRGGPVDAEDEAPPWTAGRGWRRGVGGGQRAAGTTFCSSDDRRQRGTAPGANRRRQRHREGAAAASTR
ncbi:hypothetical protein I4F81_006147 [Pyropia yezoensis]|uniref:Uncharacterized protein n=1 Tax=Pyropia yezoensis TaxID=2788 RepID=A0ACC3C161_PYRYE|nr:hypothetical protein I4F81_006147 [Neopyropia yezoensis]